MQAVAQFSRDQIGTDNESAHKFLLFISKESYGVVPFDWPEYTNDEITGLALSIYERLEHEINLLEYFRSTKYLCH